MKNLSNDNIMMTGSIAGLDILPKPKKRRWRGRKIWRKENKFTCIVKVACNSRCFDKACQNCKFLKYSRVRNLLKFAKFLDTNFSLWRWFNVFDNKQNGLQIASFSQKRRPISHNS